MNRISDADRFHEVVIDAVPLPTEGAFHEGDPIGCFTISRCAMTDTRAGEGGKGVPRASIGDSGDHAEDGR